MTTVFLSAMQEQEIRWLLRILGRPDPYHLVEELGIVQPEHYIASLHKQVEKLRIVAGYYGATLVES